MILDALKMGFTVLHTDVDIVFLRDPLPDLASHKQPLLCLWDESECNAGFIYLRPTQFTIDVYSKIKRISLDTKLVDQKALNLVRRRLMKQNPNIPFHALNKEEYVCGVAYFQRGGRHFAGINPCSRCIVVHNNWIVSKEAKRYRFQETGLWSYDDHGYYTNGTTKYLSYSNPIIPQGVNDHITIELAALQTALFIGHVLQRDVILPRFHLNQNKKKASTFYERPLNTWIKISKFDQEFYGRYRESSFLDHPKVPLAIKRNITTPYWIQTSSNMIYSGTVPSDVTVLRPANNISATVNELQGWFGGDETPVLRLHSTCGIFGSEAIPSLSETKEFRAKLDRAFVRSTYMQIT